MGGISVTQMNQELKNAADRITKVQEAARIAAETGYATEPQGQQLTNKIKQG